MNSTRISKLILSLLFLCLVTTGRAQTFPRLLLGGDYPDPSIIREGKDFYMTNSSFNYAPGLLVWHSTDLVNWTPIARALHALDGSVYAPDLVKYKGRYYIYFPRTAGNLFISHVLAYRTAPTQEFCKNILHPSGRMVSLS
jgi:beta-xylosidase